MIWEPALMHLPWASWKGAPWLGAQGRLWWWAQPGRARLGPEPFWALLRGTHELLQSRAGRERSEGAPTFLPHHRREAKPTRLVAKHPRGRSSPGSDVLTAPSQRRCHPSRSKLESQAPRSPSFRTFAAIRRGRARAAARPDTLVGEIC